MLHLGIITCVLIATSFTWITPAAAHGIPHGTHEILATMTTFQGQVREADPDAPSTVTAVRTFARVRRWLDAFALPPLSDDDSRIDPEDATGACIILRLRGRVIATGVDLNPDEHMIRRAAGRAFNEALANDVIRNIPEEMGVEVGERLTLEIDLAGRFIPLLGDSLDLIDAQLEPGLDGIAMRRDATAAAVFPAQMNALNIGGRAARLLPGLAVDLDLPPRDLNALKAQHNVGLYRFRTIHLAQRKPDRAPFETVRGDSLIPQIAVSRDSVIELADGIAQHLLTMTSREKPRGLRGAYLPSADRHEALLAAPLEQALCAVALLSYQSLESTPDRTRVRIDRATETAFLSLLHHELEDDAGVTIDALIARLEEHLTPVDELLQDEEDRAAYERWTFRRATGSMITSLDAHTLALHLWASETDSQVLIDQAWARAPATSDLSIAPWLQLATMNATTEVGGDVPHARRMRVLVEALDSLRLGDAAYPSALDLEGGFVLRKPPPGSSPRAGAQSTRPALFVARALREAAVIPQDQAMAALGRHIRTIRFLMQLQVGQDDTWQYARPDLAIGGLRESPWDCSLNSTAQALGLMTAVETIRSIDALLGPMASEVRE